MNLKNLLLCTTLSLLLCSCSLSSLTKGMDEMKKLQIRDVDLSTLADGTYEGSFDYERWSHTLEVVIAEHQITDITLVEDMKPANKKVSNTIFSRVLKEQRLTVDTVSGSTVSSKAYLKSIENALTL
ncbi:MAG: FMN-binding protein [Spirochaetia bacterium]|nr:FMN-binding protein [Spirochaetia bacterium]